MNELYDYALKQEGHRKRAYNFFSIVFMIGTIWALVVGNPFYSILSLLLTTLALVSASSSNMRMELLKRDQQEELVEKYVK